MSLPSVKIEQISKRFGNVTALKGVNLDIRDGEFITLLGPSGCGKTTLLRIIAGFENPDSGRVLIDGREVTGLAPEKRPVNMVFQRYALFPHMTVSENIAFSQVLKKKPRQEIADRVKEMLQLVNLSGYEQRRIHQLSGGQAQRVALARALINEPKVLLLDEPLGALDLRIRKQMQYELKRTQMRLKMTFVYVTHDQEEAIVMSDRIVLMNNGEIIQIGPPEEIYNAPRRIFAASFIGDTNLLSGRVCYKNGDTMELAAGKVNFWANPLPGAQIGDKLWLSIRPEKILFLDEPGADPAVQAFPARVTSRTFLGSSIRYSVDIGEGQSLDVIKPILESTRFYEVGDNVFISYSRADAILLEDEDGQNSPDRESK